MLSIVIRLAGHGDHAALARIAGRDSRPVPPAPVLLAERDGRPLAARSLETGAVVADPFAPTADLVELLAIAARTASAADAGAGRRVTQRTPAPKLALEGVWW